MRSFTKDAITKIAPVTNGMEFASELVIKAQMLRLRQDEVPVTLSPDKRDRAPHLRPWRDGWRHLRYLIMLSPSWLFFLPGLLMALAGISLFTILLKETDNPGKIVSFLGLEFGDHWSIIAGGLICIGQLSMLFGVANIVLGISAGYRRFKDYPTVLRSLLKLEYMLLAGALCCLLSGITLAYVVRSWGANSFGGLHMIREMVIANTLLILGIQTIFSGFLLSALAEKSSLFSSE